MPKKHQAEEAVGKESVTVPEARAKDVINARGEFPKGQDCIDWKCEAWKQTSLNQKSERRVRLFKAIFWPLFIVALIAGVIVVGVVYAPLIGEWFSGLFSGLIPSIP